MRRILLLVYVLLASCIPQLQKSNDLMGQNIQAMAESRQAIEENTHQIARSTDTMMTFQFVFPIIFGIVLLVLVVILFKFSRKLSKLFKDRG
ncbi:MAG: hypothetical protein K1X28_00270 [Parachlamydiales bacterium]|nr:hypothetical protein [Parachlamydiales bacterium]